MKQQMGEFGIMQGRVVEELFCRNAVAQLRLRFVPVTRAVRNIDPFGGREFDVVAHDGPPGGDRLPVRRLDWADGSQEPTDDQRCEQIDKRANALFP